MEKEKRRERLRAAMRMIDEVAADISNDQTPGGDYEWGWLEGISLGLGTFMKLRLRPGTKKAE